MKGFIISVTIAVLVWLAWIPLLLTIGPAFEARFMPVVVFNDWISYVENGRLYFRLTGRKYRPCRLLSASHAWIGDTIIENAVVYEEKDAEVYVATPTRQVGESFTSQLLYAEIPESMRARKEVRFKANYYYDCHIGYPIEQSTSIPVEIPAP